MKKLIRVILCLVFGVQNISSGGSLFKYNEFTNADTLRPSSIKVITHGSSQYYLDDLASTLVMLNADNPQRKSSSAGNNQLKELYKSCNKLMNICNRCDNEEIKSILKTAVDLINVKIERLRSPKISKAETDSKPSVWIEHNRSQRPENVKNLIIDANVLFNGLDDFVFKLKRDLYIALRVCDGTPKDACRTLCKEEVSYVKKFKKSNLTGVFLNDINNITKSSTNKKPFDDSYFIKEWILKNIDLLDINNNEKELLSILSKENSINLYLLMDLPEDEVKILSDHFKLDCIFKNIRFISQKSYQIVIISKKLEKICSLIIDNGPIVITNKTNISQAALNAKLRAVQIGSNVDNKADIWASADNIIALMIMLVDLGLIINSTDKILDLIEPIRDDSYNVQRKLLAANWGYSSNAKDIELKKFQNTITAFSNFEKIDFTIIPLQLYFDVFLKELAKIERTGIIEKGKFQFTVHGIDELSGSSDPSRPSLNQLISLADDYQVEIGYGVAGGFNSDYIEEQQVSDNIRQFLNKKIIPFVGISTADNSDFNVIINKVENILYKLSADEIRNLIIVYQPISSANSIQCINRTVNFIRHLICNKFGKDIARDIRIICDISMIEQSIDLSSSNQLDGIFFTNDRLEDIAENFGAEKYLSIDQILNKIETAYNKLGQKIIEEDNKSRRNLNYNVAINDINKLSEQKDLLRKARTELEELKTVMYYFEEIKAAPVKIEPNNIFKISA